jgi:hypothetical protein
MAVTTGTMMALSAGINMAGQLKQGRAQKKAAEIDAQQLDTRAVQEREAALQEAQSIRKAGRRTQGAARAQMAASGIDVNSGSAVDIDQEIAATSEQDARMTLLTGKRRADASNFAADQSRARGKNARTASVLGAVSTGLQGWKGVKQDEGYRYKVPTYDGAEY